MRVLVNVLLTLLLAVSWGNGFGTLLLSASEPQQNKEQNASPEQQTPPSQTQSSKTAVVKSVTGCVVQSENGYSLKTASDTYPIETEKDLSQYVNKQVEVTGVLEHQNTPSQSAGGNAQTVTDIRLRMIVTVVGDCKNPSK